MIYNTKKIYDVIIIGGGVSGLAIARHLLKYQLSVLLLEKNNDVGMESSKANSGIIHGGYAESHQTLKGRICYKGRLLFDQWEEELGIGFQKIGSLVVGFTEEDKKRINILYQQGLENGLTDLEILEASDIFDLEPQINSQVKYALYCRGAGIVPSYSLSSLLANNAMHNGLHLLLNTRVSSIKKEEDIWQVNTPTTHYQGKWIINAAGLYADDIAAMIGDDSFQIYARTGEYILCQRALNNQAIVNTILFQCPIPLGKGVVVQPTYHHNILIGPDAQNEDNKNVRDTHIDRLSLIFQKAKYLFNGLDPKKIIKNFTGRRAVSLTDDFIIQKVPQKNFIHVAGIQSPGLTSSPYIALMVADILKSHNVAFIPNPRFHPSAHKNYLNNHLEPMKKIAPCFHLKEGDPERIVCRCEQIKEKDIIAMLQTPVSIHTFDAMKRRLRTGMGACQGKQCQENVLALIKKYSPAALLHQKTDIEKDKIHRVPPEDLKKL